MLNILLFALSIFFTSSAFAVDAKNYLLMPVGTDITELRISYNEITVPGVGNTQTKIVNQYELLKHAHYFNLNDHLAAIYVAVPYVNFKETNYQVRGVADATILFAYGVYNMPALTPEAYSKFDQNGLSSACSISLTIPSGKYNSSQFFNIGENRYSQKAECQLGWMKDKFLFEATVGLTHYQNNNSYFGNNRLKQDNLYHFETHSNYNFTPRFWASFDTFYTVGGEMNINGQYVNNKQDSLAAGFLLGYVIDQKQFVKLIYQNTVSASSTSTKQEGLTLSYSYIW